MTPKEYQELAQPLVDVYIGIENDLMKNIARRFKDNTAVGTNEWQIQKLSELRALNSESDKIISKGVKGLDENLYNALRTAGEGNAARIDKLLAEAAAKGIITHKPDEAVMANILNAYFKSAKNKFNLADTTMLGSAQNEYIKIVNQTTGAVLTGTQTGDEALRATIRQFAAAGLPAFVDEANRRWSPEAYIDNVVRSTSCNVANNMQFARMDEYDVDLIEVSSHLGARPLCAMFQGRIYSRNGKSAKYPSFYDTSYGMPAGLLGCNCRHVIYPYIEGVSIQRYTPYDKAENARAYELSQQQRKLERGIRNAKREKEVFEAAGDTKGIIDAEWKIKAKQAQMREFIKQTGLPRQYHREQVVPTVFEPVKNPLHKDAKSSILKTKSDNNMKRKTKNIGEFAHLQEPMQLRHVEKIAKKYDIDTKDLTIKIQRDTRMINTGYFGSADPMNIGRIDLYPDSFQNEEQIVRTIVHEKTHIEQFKKYGGQYVMNNPKGFEDEAEHLEEQWIRKWFK